MAGMNRLLPFGVATAAMLGAMGADDAEAAAFGTFKPEYVKNYYNNIMNNIHAGYLEPAFFKEVKKVYPDAINEVWVSPHAADSRLIKNGWSPERAADLLADIMNSKNGFVVPNIKKSSGKGKHADYGALVPYDIDPVFSPFILGDNKELIFKTGLSPRRGQLKQMGFGEEGGQSLISRYHDDNFVNVTPSTQQRPFSVVPPGQPEFKNSIRGWDKLVKKGGAGTGVTIGATLGNPQDAWASYMPKEKGLSEPWLDPVSMLTAPIGVAGAGAKAVATALDPAINAIMQSLLGE